MVQPLHDVLVKPPGETFGAAFEDASHGFRHPVDLDEARREHALFVRLLESLGVTVHVLAEETESRFVLQLTWAAGPHKHESY